MIKNIFCLASVLEVVKNICESDFLDRKTAIKNRNSF